MRHPGTPCLYIRPILFHGVSQPGFMSIPFKTKQVVGKSIDPLVGVGFFFRSMLFRPWYRVYSMPSQTYFSSRTFALQLLQRQVVTNIFARISSPCFPQGVPRCIVFVRTRVVPSRSWRGDPNGFAYVACCCKRIGFPWGPSGFTYGSNHCSSDTPEERFSQ